MMKTIFGLLSVLLLTACGSMPSQITPVTGFELNKYAGRWYEVARLDHRFERGLEAVTATYSINDDGTVKVVNRGWETDDDQWDDAVGRARFAGSSDVGHLEVSFFGFFFGDYIIFELDKPNYQYAWVTGGENTLWFLSRSPVVSDELMKRFVTTVEGYGYNTEELILVDHSKSIKEAE